MNKRDVMEMIGSMPDEIDLDELLDRIYVLKRIEIAEQELDEGRFISHDEFVKRSDQWLSSSG